MYTIDNRVSLTKQKEGFNVIPKVTTQEAAINTYNSFIDDGSIKILGKAVTYGPNWKSAEWNKFLKTGVR